MLNVALKMLFRDRAKYAMLVCGLAFCSLLMCQQSSVFCGLMMWTTATVRNIGAPVWVVDAKVEQANEVIPMRQIEVDRVRSVKGVAWAVPLLHRHRAGATWRWIISKCPGRRLGYGRSHRTADEHDRRAHRGFAFARFSGGRSGRCRKISPQRHQNRAGNLL
jgi:hypothetical protein